MAAGAVSIIFVKKHEIIENSAICINLFRLRHI